MNEEADSGDDEHHDHGKMIEIDAEVDGEIPGLNPCAVILLQRGMPGLHEDGRLKAGDKERGSGGGESNGGDGSLGEALAEEAVGERTKQRENRNEPGLE